MQALRPRRFTRTSTASFSDRCISSIIHGVDPTSPSPIVVRHSPSHPSRFARMLLVIDNYDSFTYNPVSYTHLRAHETGRNLVCRLLLEKKKKYKRTKYKTKKN